MTIELGSRTRFAASTLALVVSVGCTTTQQQPPQDRLEKTTVVSPAGTNPRPAENLNDPTPAGNTVSATKRHQAQQIYLKALEIFEAKEYDLAYIEFSRALDVDPNYHLAWFKKGLCAYYKQRYDLEIQCYQRCLEIQPDHLDALLNLANAYLAQDQLERAVPIYRRILVIDPNHPVALYNLGICYYDLQDYRASIEHLRRFSDLYPQDPSRTKADDLSRRALAKHQAVDTQR